MEKKYESDLTRKEKRQLEWEKVKGLRGKDKIEYLWTYYKYWLFILLGVGAIVSIGITMFQNARINSLLSIAIVDANWTDDNTFEQLENELLEVVGTGGKYDEVTVDVSATSATSPEQIMKATILFSIGSGTDLAVCDPSMYERFSKQGVFADWKEVLGDDYDSYAPYLTNGLLDLSKSPKWSERVYTLYEPNYVLLLTTSENTEHAIQFLEYFFK